MSGFVKGDGGFFRKKEPSGEGSVYGDAAWRSGEPIRIGLVVGVGEAQGLKAESVVQFTRELIWQAGKNLRCIC